MSIYKIATLAFCLFFMTLPIYACPTFESQKSLEKFKKILTHEVAAVIDEYSHVAFSFADIDWNLDLNNWYRITTNTIKEIEWLYEIKHSPASEDSSSYCYYRATTIRGPEFIFILEAHQNK